ncbi:MAG: cephalosporin hydroxylase family protein [Xanthobacteraceae bacterium]|nr:cephalosporin hydroxylase family protein [Xanthobacteraceae bacterium]
MSSHDPKDLALIRRMGADSRLAERANEVFVNACRYRYSYNFTWLGRPIIQFPQDIVALQEIIWKVKPDLVIETGVAHGGSLVFSASILELLGGSGRVLGIDIDIRPHNRAAIEAHPLAKRVDLLQGSSIDERIVEQVCAHARGKDKVMVVLDSNHTHAHVAAELRLYSPLVTKGSYLIVCDTVVDDMPADCFPDRPWGPGDSPKTAVREFLKSTERFQIDEEYENKLLLTVCPEGYLECIA